MGACGPRDDATAGEARASRALSGADKGQIQAADSAFAASANAGDVEGVAAAKGVPGVTDEGKFLVILRKQPGGEWKLLYDMYSSDLAQEH